MTLGAPLGLLALAGLPVLIGLYFLRRRSTPRVVSALFLWRSTEDVAKAGPRWRRLNREVSLALECAALIAGALFLADVRLDDANGPSLHAVIVVDGSLSMRARGKDGRTAVERARVLVRQRLEAAASATLIESGTRPRVLAGPPRQSASAPERYPPAFMVPSSLRCASGWVAARDAP